MSSQNYYIPHDPSFRTLMTWQPSLTQCLTDLGACEQFDTCNIKSPLQRLNDEVLLMLSRTTIAQCLTDLGACEQFDTCNIKMKTMPLLAGNERTSPPRTTSSSL